MSIAWSSDFTYKYFRRILDAIKGGFQCHPICESPQILGSKGSPKLLLRHDVDISLPIACRMAEIEAECRLRATYMVMTNGLLYSLTDDDSRRILRLLIAMGHEVALHFDIGALEGNGKVTAIEMEIDTACKQLEDVLGLPVQSISFHRPGSYDGLLSPFSQGPLFVADRVNAYAADLMGGYLSDSKGSWRDGEPLPKLLSPAKPLLQLLIHPIWWGEEHMAPQDRLEAFFLAETQGSTPSFTQTFDDRLAATVPAVLRRHFPERTTENGKEDQHDSRAIQYRRSCPEAANSESR
jgi:hypothetical protein